MPWNSTVYASAPQFVADWESIARNTGRQIDWIRVPTSYIGGTDYTITVNDADAAEGDTTLGVDATPVALPVGTTLDFGALPLDQITVTTSSAASAGATNIAVTALTGAIPAGAVLNFTGAGEFALVTADAAAGATSLAVEALDAAIEQGDTATWPGVAQRQTVVVSAYAAAGAISLTVYPLSAPIQDDAAATFTISASGDKVIPAGTVMCQLSGGKIVPRVARPGSEEAIGLLMSTATENSRVDSLSGYGIIVGGVIYENLLPETITSYKTELNTNGLGWVWQTYADNTEV